MTKNGIRFIVVAIEHWRWMVAPTKVLYPGVRISEIH